MSIHCAVQRRLQHLAFLSGAIKITQCAVFDRFDVLSQALTLRFRRLLSLLEHVIERLA